jgi:hypothetical protein
VTPLNWMYWPRTSSSPLFTRPRWKNWDSSLRASCSMRSPSPSTHRCSCLRASGGSGPAALAGGDAALVAFEILADHQLVAADGEGALGEHDVAFEDVDLVLVVDRDPVGLDVDGLAAVGPFGVGLGAARLSRGEGEGKLPGGDFHGFGVGAFR